jgi:hypothetical protein
VMVVERTLLVDSGVVEGMAVVEVDEAVRPNNLNIVVKNFKVYFGSILHINNLQLCSNFFHFFCFFPPLVVFRRKICVVITPPPTPPPLLSLVVIQRKICVPTNPTPPLPLTLHCCDPTKKFRVY